ncbi:MAG TPA: hypothetical protein VFE62_15955 [Gemmataceae bacterium]|nr:hypothetical protein [Gemmataceae bacterium]
MKQSDLIDRLRKSGWEVVTRPDRALRLPPEISARHSKLPAALTKFLGSVDSCINETQTAWFLCEADYAGTSGAAFRWDEWEQLSLNAAGDDGRFAAKVRAFWDAHLPFLLSVRDGYAYFAIRTAADGFGRIVRGCEPEFEEASQIANSFEEFLSLLADGGIRA